MAAGGRVLIHLLLQGEVDGTRGGRSSQEIISNQCGIGRTHVHRTLKPMIADGLIREDMGRLPGHMRKTKIYSLTERGTAEADLQMEEARAVLILWKDEDGRDRAETVFDSAREINDILGASGLPLIPVPLLLSTDEGTLSWSEILWVSNSLRKGRSEGRISLPGWSTMRFPDPPASFLDREGEFRGLAELIGSGGGIVIQGQSGSGKRSLAGHFAERKGLISAWITISENGEEAELDPDSVDLLVLVDTTGPDPLSLLMDGSGGYISGIREDLPEEIRGLPLIVIREWIDEEAGDPHITLEGLPGDVFVRSCMDLGLNSGLAGSLHRASKGFPSALSYLRSLPDRDLKRILRSDPEDAILGIILGMNEGRGGFNTESSQKLN